MYMALRFRKSIKVAPGVRLNISKKSIGVSAGVKGYRKSINSSGRVTTSVGVPGTGVSYVTTKNVKKSGNPSASAHSTAAPSSSSGTGTARQAERTAVQKEKKPKTAAVLLDKPDASFIVFAVIIFIFAFFLSGASIPAGIIVALFGVYFIYCYVDFKRHPDNPKYITEEQLARWAQLISSDKKTLHDLQKASLPVLLELKNRSENYYSQLSCAINDTDIQKCSELLLDTQQKIVDLSEFVIIKGDEPQKDFEKYSSLVEELK